MFYAEYNLRLFFFLLFRRMDAICAIDLDTIMPCLFISWLKNIPRIYDAHELFTGLKEVATRPSVLRIWKSIESFAVPKFKKGYTVSESIAIEFNRRYRVNYETIRNTPRLLDLADTSTTSRFIIYQGAVNEARAFEQLIPAMQWVNAPLVICGDGNFMPQLKQLIQKNKLEHKIELKGMLPPSELWKVSQQAYAGVAVAENTGMNQYLALPNKFFDYIHAGLPQVTMNYPEYQKLNSRYEVAVLIDGIEPRLIADALNKLLDDTVMYSRLRNNCLRARLDLNWQNEEKRLLSFYKKVFE